MVASNIPLTGNFIPPEKWTLAKSIMVNRLLVGDLDDATRQMILDLAATIECERNPQPAEFFQLSDADA